MQVTMDDMSAETRAKLEEMLDFPVDSVVERIRHVVKQSADSYFISGEPRGFGWARVFLMEGERTPDHRFGYLSIISDYGNFGYFWSHIGCRSFREFLSTLEFSYAMEKLRGEHWKRFDLDASVKLVKTRIVHARRHREIDSKTARQLRRKIEAIAEDCAVCDGRGIQP